MQFPVSKEESEQAKAYARDFREKQREAGEAARVLLEYLEERHIAVSPEIVGKMTKGMNFYATIFKIRTQAYKLEKMPARIVQASRSPQKAVEQSVQASGGEVTQGSLLG